MLINGIKFACNTCVKGHRSSNCNHTERPLFEIRKKGRPVTQCAFCRDLRKTRQIHIKCTCTNKTKNIENTSITTQCYQCPTSLTKELLEEQGMAYSDLIQNTIKPSKEGSIECTCHETANKILQQQDQFSWSQQQHQQKDTILPVKSRSSMMMMDYTKRFSNTGSTKRRRSSGGNHKRKLSLNQNFTEIEPECTSTTTIAFHSSSTSSSSSSSSAYYSPTTTNSNSSTSTPNSFINSSTNFGEHYNDLIMMNTTTHPAELTNLLNNVLNEREQEEYNYSNAMMSGIDMTRSTTSNSSCSFNLPFQPAPTSPPVTLAPSIQQQQQQQQVHQQVCGSFTLHSNCSPAMDTQGESVVITITPLSSIFTSDKEERENNKTKPVTRIVTCYCGSSCICPGCFVHPNNYLIQQELTMQQLQHYSMQQQQQQISNNTTSSSYSSDDEDQYHMNYTTTSYSLF